MGLWHGVEFYENEKLGDKEFLRPAVREFVSLFSLFFNLPLRVTMRSLNVRGSGLVTAGV